MRLRPIRPCRPWPSSAYRQALPSASAQPSSLQSIATPPALNEFQLQLHDTQSSLVSHVDKFLSLEGVIAEHEAIKRDVSLLSWPEWSKGSPKDGEDEEFANDDHAHSLYAIVPYELAHVDEEDEENTAPQDADESHEGGGQSWIAHARQNQLTRKCRIQGIKEGIMTPVDHTQPSQSVSWWWRT